jgi:hypothetical protein
MERGGASVVPGGGRAAEARELEEGPGRLREGGRLESGVAKGSGNVVVGVWVSERDWVEGGVAAERVGLADAEGSNIVAGGVVRKIGYKL